MSDRLKILLNEEDKDFDCPEFRAGLLHSILHAINDSGKNTKMTGAQQESFILERIVRYFAPETPQIAFRKCGHRGGVLKWTMLAELQRYQLKELGYVERFMEKHLVTSFGISCLHLSPESLLRRIDSEFKEYINAKRASMKK